MIEQAATPQQQSTTAATSSRQLARPAGIAIASTALVALCAHISIPLGFTPVPVTLQPFAVLLLGLVLSPGLSFAALTLYLLEGATGLPVFSPHGPGGLAQLFGPTGGYLLAAPFAAALAGTLYRVGRRSVIASLAGAAAGDLVLLVTGALWLQVLAHMHLAALVHLAIYPFVGTDAAKVLAAAACAQIFHSFTRTPAQQR